MKQIESRVTTPIENVLAEDPALFELFLKQFLELSLKTKPKVECHKEKLGPQTFTWNGEFRFWVWDRKGYRLFVSNLKGLCFEVPPETTPTQAFQTWRSYCDMMNR